ncbi:unnamed protein product [Acanthoscelides obtectus]|uniref:Uncharacterized protein n=1 Tax=Acanthoscelides obtectus TaxID=200917 RepID=A0A9P0LL27_ACAOB|nr:unnamed protein product [Acanthoscelides obtectus]CAK1640445.1 hypothetical protein AOBTE_LOCUS11725 [Acanthoscelides obtectus]
MSLGWHTLGNRREDHRGFPQAADTGKKNPPAILPAFVSLPWHSTTLPQYLQLSRFLLMRRAVVGIPEQLRTLPYVQQSAVLSEYQRESKFVNYRCCGKLSGCRLIDTQH